MLNRRSLIRLTTGFAASISSVTLLSKISKNYSISPQKRHLPLLLGWYDYINNPNLPAQVSDKGIDLLMPYVQRFENTNIQTFLDASEKAGVKVLLEIYRSLVEPENIAGVKEFVNTYKNHPSVYGWYLYDEPEIKKPTPLSPNSLKRLYYAIKEEDKSKPVALVFANIKKIPYYMDAMDILMWDHYPCEHGVQEFQWVSSYQNALNKVTHLASANNKKFWNVLQAYSNHHSNKRLPTKAEFRYMFYSSVLAGADGLLFWMHHLSSAYWNQSVLYPTVKEIRDYIPAIVKGEDLTHLVQVNHSDIKVKVFSIPNSKQYLMIALNQNQAQINFTIKFSQRIASKIDGINQKNVIKLSDQANFSYVLHPYEVQMYKI